MIKLVITGMCAVKDAPPDVVKIMQDDLTIENPKYTNQRKIGKSIRGIQQYLELFVMRGSSIIIPRGYMNRAIFRLKGHEYTVIDNTVCPALEEPVSFKGILRLYQEKAVTDCLVRRYGMLEAATGSGKTVMAMALIERRQTRALIIVHNTELLNQWRDRIQEHMGYSVGLMGNGHFEIKDITVGIINTVRKHSTQLSRHFGFVIYDECHRTMGVTWFDTINTLAPKYHLGVTATPSRSDGMAKALYAIVGPKLHVVDTTMLEDTGAVLIPTIIRVSTNFYVPNEERFEYQTIISMLVSDIPRNVLIAETVFKDYTKHKEPIAVVSDRVGHCKELYELIGSYRFLKPLLLHGSISKDQRVEGLRKFKAGEYNILISTLQLIGEGFDAPDLSALFLATPLKFSGRVIQSIGRVLRPSGSDNPRVYDFRDYNVSMLKYSGFSRDRTYKSKGWTK